MIFFGFYSGVEDVVFLIPDDGLAGFVVVGELACERFTSGLGEGYFDGGLSGLGDEAEFLNGVVVESITGE